MSKPDVLLVLLPFWTPQVPPLGISCLKGFLQQRGYRVKTLDANIEKRFKQIYQEYFAALGRHIPPVNRGNFYNSGHDVLRSHLMAHIYYSSERDYVELLRAILYQHFFCKIDDGLVSSLLEIAAEFYRRLQGYFLEVLEKEEPGVLGLSVYSGTLPASLFAFRLTREKHPHIRTVMGGGIFADQLNASSPDFQYFLEKTPYIDKIIIGEGEHLLLRWLEGDLPDGQRVYTMEDINRKSMVLSSAAMPDFSDFLLEYYLHLTAYASRSCPFQCAFCSETVQWGKYRKKNPQQVADELVKLSGKYRRQMFLLGDSLLNPVVSGLADECREMESTVYWDGYLRAENQVCDPGNTLSWRQGGFYRARLGVESGSGRMLEAMGKSITPGQIKGAVSALAEAGIKTTTYWVIGYPGETEADFLQTLNLIEELKYDIYEAECNPFNYFLTGQVKSEHWSKTGKSTFLYPVDAGEMLLVPPRIMTGSPSREETYERMTRFTAHCQQLGIPNPYSLQEISSADERWIGLHKNAVPPLLSFNKKGTYLDECKQVKKLSKAGAAFHDNGDWGF